MGTLCLNEEHKSITKQLNIDLVILVNSCILSFICLNAVAIQIMKCTIKSLPLQRWHLPGYCNCFLMIQTLADSTTCNSTHMWPHPFHARQLTL